MIAKLLRLLREKRPDLSGAGIVALASVACSVSLLAVRHLGGLQHLELMAYDQMVLRRADFGPDPRLLVVGITEEDIQRLQQSTLSDQVVAQMLEKLQQYQPAVIGLDVFRDIPQEKGAPALKAQLQKPNTIAIAKMGTSGTGTLEVPPPPNVPVERIGFNDILQDPDGVVRRSLLFSNLTPDTTLFSFAMQLAMQYLAAKGQEPNNSPNNPNSIRWGMAVFLPLEENSGGYQRIDAKGYQLVLNYRSPSHVARTVSLRQVLSGWLDPSWVKDKIVLIGYTAPSRRDLFLTPYSPANRKEPKMAGVLVHAHIVSQILSAVLGERPLFRFWPEWGEVLWVALWAAVGGTLGWWGRHPAVLALSGTAMLGVLVGSCFYLLTRAVWVPVATPALSLALSATSVVTYRAYQAQQQQQIVMKLLGQNTSPEVADALWNNRFVLLKEGKLPGQKLTATMLFTDLKDFSTISEQMPPERLMEWLNEYLSALTHEVGAHRGIVNKFTGDGIMAVFGVPVARTTEAEIASDARHAVACGLAFGERLGQLNQDWKRRGLPVVQMRVGIFTGPVVAGSLGGSERLEYGIIGDSVNIASRLESCEKDRQSSICRVLIAKETLVYLQDQFLVEPWGSLALKGKHQTVDVYRVVAWRSRSKTEG